MTSFPAFSSILAEAAKGPEGILGNPIIMPVVILVVFYFLMIRPQQTQRKEQAARVSALQSGDKVVTTAGIHGIVHNVKDNTVVIKVAEGTMIEFDKASIATVHKKDSSAK
ncbi:MAG: preprotein translocase subunit YajC [Luteolibacter sp.]|uniref:preprotein translocase subunit YajC n=1 Tax=Luteolibacter sp. TaxID=1962973 RepID=UPI0032651AF0